MRRSVDDDVSGGKLSERTALCQSWISRAVNSYDAAASSAIAGEDFVQSRRSRWDLWRRHNRRDVSRDDLHGQLTRTRDRPGGVNQSVLCSMSAGVGLRLRIASGHIEQAGVKAVLGIRRHFDVRLDDNPRRKSREDNSSHWRNNFLSIHRRWTFLESVWIET